VLVLLAAEAGARLASRVGRYQPKIVTEEYLRWNPYLFQVLRPGSYATRGGGRIEVNSLGFRGPEFSARKPAGVYRIFALGGSTTFGYPESIPATEDTYPFKLQARLQARGGTVAVEVINAGVVGYTLRTSLVNFVTRLQWYDPDLIVVNHAVNDAITIREEDDLLRAVARAQAPTPWEWLRDRSFVLLEANFRIFARLWHPSARGVVPSDQPATVTLAGYERHLRDLVALARAHGVAVVIANESVAVPEACADGRIVSEADRGLRPIEARICFLMQWYFPHLTPLGVKRTFEALASIQRRVAEAEGLVWVDLSTVVPRTAEYYWDLCHTRPAATTLVADALADRVAPLIRARAPSSDRR